MMVYFKDAFLLCCFALFAFRRSLRYLHIFQQEEYDAVRFVTWMFKTASFDRRLTTWLFLWSVVIAHLFGYLLAYNALLLGSFFAFFAAAEIDPRRIAKKKLAMTQRATRVCAVSFALCCGAGLLVLTTHKALLWILPLQFIPFSLILSNFALTPVEARIQNKIIEDAKRSLAQSSSTVIGITGSFGKTSVKHILGHILEMNAPTLFTPGSVNTMMGVSRIIRENLKQSIRYFIVEMGAYGVGSIARLCSLAPPHIGIITAIGEAHYERFKSLDAVAHAKFELAHAVLANGNGKIIIHESVLVQPYAKSVVDACRERFVVCGSLPGAALTVRTVEQTSHGLNIALQWQGQEIELFAPLYGKHHAGNIALAFATALTLGLSIERVTSALRTVPQIKHRLEVKPQGDGSIYIDDGFNSNREGFISALDLLHQIGTENSARRILITPGIIELGTRHDEVHAELGKKAAQCADIALIICGERIKSFVESFRAMHANLELHEVDNLEKALIWHQQHKRPTDIVLIENDLPDMGEGRLSL